MATRQPLPRRDHAAVGIGSKLYVWGGWNSSNKIKTTALETFDVTSVQWEQSQLLNGSSVPDGLRGMAVTSDGKTAYCCCGRTGSHPNYTYYNTVFEITPSQHLYKELQPTSPSLMPEKTSGSRVVRFQDKLILFGGSTGRRWTNELHIFDLKKSECELCMVLDT